jgi:hypothetical protein
MKCGRARSQRSGPCRQARFSEVLPARPSSDRRGRGLIQAPLIEGHGPLTESGTVDRDRPQRPDAPLIQGNVALSH